MSNVIDQTISERFALYHGDAVETLSLIPENTIGLTVSSPPFPGMYTYTNSPRDIGNTASIEEMIGHYRHLCGPMLRATMPGRMAAIHLCQIPAFKEVDGYIGLKDFRGKVIETMEQEGWIYYGEVCIDKDPQVKAFRTKDSTIQFKSLATDSARMRMALADYLLQFRKPGENPERIPAGKSAKYNTPNGWITNDEWIRWARPIWLGADLIGKEGIRETDVLNVACARDSDDERHLCPLQLGVIERAVKLWSAPDDVVLDPFSGVSSTGVKAIELGRKYVGIELKRSYYDTSVRNLTSAENRWNSPDQGSLFAGVEMEEVEA